jgi:hypothetical protein
MDLDGAEKTPIRKSEKFSLQDLYPLMAPRCKHGRTRDEHGGQAGGEAAAVTLQIFTSIAVANITANPVSIPDTMGPPSKGVLLFSLVR